LCGGLDLLENIYVGQAFEVSLGSRTDKRRK
jgi:hypothetical protein